VFAIVRQVAALLVNGTRADRLRAEAARAWGGDASPYAKPTARQPIEYLDVAERHRLFDMVERLMQGWPHRFVHACDEADLHRSHAIRDMTNPPFAYEEVMRAYMDRSPYYASEGARPPAISRASAANAARPYTDTWTMSGGRPPRHAGELRQFQPVLAMALRILLRSRSE
jgi:hypothetical protein